MASTASTSQLATEKFTVKKSWNDVAVGTRLICINHSEAIFEKTSECTVKVVEAFKSSFTVGRDHPAGGLEEMGCLVEPPLFDVSKFIVKKSFDELAVGTKYINSPKTAIFEKISQGMMQRKCLWTSTGSWTVDSTYTHPHREDCFVELTSFDLKLLRPDKKIIKKFSELPIGTLYVRTSNPTFDHHLCWVKISETECRHVNGDGSLQVCIERQSPEQACAIADVLIPDISLFTQQILYKDIPEGTLYTHQHAEMILKKTADNRKNEAVWTKRPSDMRQWTTGGDSPCLIVPVETPVTPQPCTERVDFALMKVGEEFSASQNTTPYWKKTGDQKCIHKDTDISKWTPDDVTRRSVMHTGSTWVTKELADKVAARVASATPKRKQINVTTLFHDKGKNAVRLGQIFYKDSTSQNKMVVAGCHGYIRNHDDSVRTISYGTLVWIDDAPLQPVNDPSLKEVVKDGDDWKVVDKKLDMIEVPFALVTIGRRFTDGVSWHWKETQTSAKLSHSSRTVGFDGSYMVKIEDDKHDFDWVPTANLLVNEWYRLEPNMSAQRYFKKNDTTAADSPTHMEDRPLAKYGWVTKACKENITKRLAAAPKRFQMSYEKVSCDGNGYTVRLGQEFYKTENGTEKFVVTGPLGEHSKDGVYLRQYSWGQPVWVDDMNLKPAVTVHVRTRLPISQIVNDENGRPRVGQIFYSERTNGNQFVVSKTGSLADQTLLYGWVDYGPLKPGVAPPATVAINDGQTVGPKPSIVSIPVSWSPEAVKTAQEVAEKMTVYENVSSKESEMSAKKMSFASVPLGRKFWFVNAPDKLYKKVTDKHAKQGFGKPEDVVSDITVFLKPLMRQKYASGITLGAQFGVSLLAVATWIIGHIDYSLPLGERIKGVMYPTASLVLGIALIIGPLFLWTDAGEDLKKRLEED